MYFAELRRRCVRAGVRPWKPGQMRHSFTTEVRPRFGLEAAQLLLGHKRADASQVYAEAALAMAGEAARAMV